MPRTVLQLVQQVAMELGIPTPSQLSESTNQTNQQLRELSNREGTSLRDWFKWPQLLKEGSFTLVDAQAGYALPDDLESFISDTFWDQSNQWPLIGAVSPQHWQWRKNGISSVTPRKEFRIRGVENGQFLVHPTPDSGEAGNVLVYEYVSKDWLRPATWVTGTVYMPGAYTFYNGNKYYTELGGVSGVTEPTHTSGTATDGGVDWTFNTDAYERITQDDDIVILDNNVFQLGLKWRWTERVKLDYTQLYADYVAARSRAQAKLQPLQAVQIGGRYMNNVVSTRNIPDGQIGL